MYKKSLKTLEYEKIIKLLGDEAESSLGKDYCLSLEPSTDFEEIKEWIRKTDEAFRLIIKEETRHYTG